MVIDNRQCSASIPALVKLSECGGVVVICDNKHMPISVLLPIASHTETVLRINDQIAAGKPLVKQLWRQIVIRKILGQAANLDQLPPVRRQLEQLAARVQSGDKQNHEAQAARLYWPAFAAAIPDFKRDHQAEGMNSMLNFGYAVVRAAMARALVGAGFCTAIGLYHHHRGNAFCLADDLMEPLRPLVDARAMELFNTGREGVTAEVKQGFYRLLLDPVMLAGQRIPLLDGTQRTAASLAACLRRESRELLLPERERA